MYKTAYTKYILVDRTIEIESLLKSHPVNMKYCIIPKQETHMKL